ncbi:MAG: AglZ/HisF2 family acetamidino modification protein [Bacteroidota bacterium]|jgi:cyclase
MLRTRIIPCLLLKGQGLVKTIKFQSPTYIGDPINAVKIFNDKEVDELVFLDITATLENRPPNFKLLRQITDECFMPLAYGGGIRSIDQIAQLLKAGIEKVIINSAAYLDQRFLAEAVRIFGSSTIVVSIDVKKKLLGKHVVYIKSGTYATKEDPVAYAKRIEELGAGEILLNSINADGTMKGYDLSLIRAVSHNVSIPVVACGGAGSIQDLRLAKEAGASAVAAGSMFVFQGPNRAVLISYPQIRDLEEKLDSA